MDNLRSITFDNQYFLRLNSGKALRRGVTGSSEACLACPQTPMMDPTSGPWKSGRTASQSQTLPCVECRLASFFASSSSQMRTELSVGNYLGARRSLTVLRLLRLLLLPGFAVAVVRASLVGSRSPTNCQISSSKLLSELWCCSVWCESAAVTRRSSSSHIYVPNNPI